MKNTFGNSVTLTISGESHGEALVAILDGLRAGIKVDTDFIKKRLALRRPSGSISTSRQEADEFSIVSGVFEGYTTGTPVCIVIPNTSKKSSDYDELKFLPRPSHADLTAYLKYGGYQDYRGGGHFSGRVTAAIVAAGAIAESALAQEGITIGTHIKNIGNIYDAPFSSLNDELPALKEEIFPVISREQGEKMKALIEETKKDLDSIGGALETAVIGIGGGYGEPWFDTVEGLLSHVLFSIPGVKAVSFGAGEDFSKLKGSTANDPFTVENEMIVTASNNSGGINGGITNGMPIIFSVTVRPTPSIAREQSTVDMRNNEEKSLSIHGRHDPCIVHRAAHVVNACTAIAILDIITTRDGSAPRNKKI